MLRLWGYGASGAATQHEQEKCRDPHLRSTSAVTGYTIQALNDIIGHVNDFILDDQNWVICYLVVDTHNSLPGKRVLVSPHWIGTVSWEQHAVQVNLPKGQIKAGPEYNPKRVLNREELSTANPPSGKETSVGRFG